MKLSSPVRVLVTDAQERAVLASLRSLSAAGADVTAVGVSRLAPGLWSSAPHRRRIAPDPGEDLPGFIARLERLLRAMPHDLLFPGTDAALLAISRHRDTLIPLVRHLGLPAAEVVEAALDRRAVTAAAQSVGLASPRSRICDSVDAALEAGRELGFPVVIKPIATVVAGPSATRRFASALVEDEIALRRRAKTLGASIVQERVSGPVISVGGLAASDRVSGYAVSRYLRTWPRAAGNVCWSETIAPPPGLIERVRKMVQALHWEGIFELELIETDGGHAVIDFNPRAYGSLSLAVAAGAPLPALWCAHLMGQELDDRVWAARPGVRYRWGEADVSHLGQRLLRSGPWGIWADGRPRRHVTHAYFQRTDPVPLAARAVWLCRHRTPQTRVPGKKPTELQKRCVSPHRGAPA